MLKKKKKKNIYQTSSIMGTIFTASTQTGVQISMKQKAVNVASECDCVSSHTDLKNLISSLNNNRLLASTLMKLGPLQRNWFIDFFVHAFSYYWSFNQQETKKKHWNTDFWASCLVDRKSYTVCTGLVHMHRILENMDGIHQPIKCMNRKRLDHFKFVESAQNI